VAARPNDRRTDDGPCLTRFRAGSPWPSPISGFAQRWPRFVPAARRTDFEAVHALPMRLRSEVIGALNLFTTQAEDLGGETLRLSHALADGPPSACSRRGPCGRATP
jgi:hypothetical protein